MSPLPVSATLQDYLEVILLCSQEGTSVRVTDIAGRMSLTKASVNQALKSLKEQGLIAHPPYGPVELTHRGRELACIVNHRHRVLLAFLRDVLKLDERTAEHDACQMEHAVSSKTIEHLLEFMAAYGFSERISFKDPSCPE